MEHLRPGSEADRFILDSIDTVPHLEALLLLWRDRAGPWTVEHVAKRLWVEPAAARVILQDLVRLQLLEPVPGDDEQYGYRSDPKHDRQVEAVEAAYREDMIRITRMIHAKPSAAVRAFAKAFRLKKDKD